MKQIMIMNNESPEDAAARRRKEIERKVQERLAAAKRQWQIDHGFATDDTPIVKAKRMR